MNVKGGGISHVNDFTSDEMKLFRGGLRQVASGQNKLIYDTTAQVKNYHDKYSYERGFISHSRSPSNQYLNFHFMFGGFKKYALERHFYQNYYRRVVRNCWLPCLIAYTTGCLTMRMYDNAAYDYFYFSD